MASKKIKTRTVLAAGHRPRNTAVTEANILVRENYTISVASRYKFMRMTIVIL